MNTLITKNHSLGGSMPFFFVYFIEAMVFVIALSIDAFLASFAYGVDRIRIPVSSLLIISSMSGAVLGIFMLVGSIAGKRLPEGAGAVIGFILLFLVGICKLFDGAIKWYIRKCNNIEKNINFHFSSLKFLLTIYADPHKADVDKGGILSSKEAISLGIALSIDSAAAGIGAGVMATPLLLSVVLTWITNILAIVLGSCLGYKIAQKISLDFSWISGILLIILGFSKLW